MNCRSRSPHFRQSGQGGDDLEGIHHGAVVPGEYPGGDDLQAIDGEQARERREQPGTIACDKGDEDMVSATSRLHAKAVISGERGAHGQMALDIPDIARQEIPP